METAIGIAAGILTSVSMLPQLVKVIREKEVDDISSKMIATLILGVSLWVVYGIMKKEWPIILSNIFSVLVNCTLLGYYFLFKSK